MHDKLNNKPKTFKYIATIGPLNQRSPKNPMGCKFKRHNHKKQK